MKKWNDFEEKLNTGKTFKKTKPIRCQKELTLKVLNLAKKILT